MMASYHIFLLMTTATLLLLPSQTGHSLKTRDQVNQVLGSAGELYSAQQRVNTSNITMLLGQVGKFRLKSI